MPLPSSFLKDGFVPAAKVRPRRRLMLCLYGGPDSGKTEFALSAPGPGIVLGLDRGIDGMLDNPNPPKSRNADEFGFKTIAVPLATQMAQPQYVEYWKAFYTEYKKALENADCRTVILDGDSDSWELQRLAEFGRTSKVPPNAYDQVNAARRAMYARAHDSGKIFIATNRVRKVYITKMKADGITPEVNAGGNEVRIWNGEYERQGFSDQDYLWQVHCMMLYNADASDRWGLRITKCKPDRTLEGTELWGSDCNFRTLVELIYPNVSPEEWGYR